MKTALLLLASLVFSASAVVAAATEEQATANLQKLLAAQAAKNYDEFVANATPAFKTALSKQQFEGAADFLSKRFKDGYDTKYLGELNQQGCQIFLFKIQCKDGGDDLLASLAMKDDKVAGIFFK